MRIIRGRLTATLAVVAFVLAAVTGCGSEPSMQGAADGTSFVAGDGSIVVVAPPDRGVAPDLAGSTLAGDEFRLSDHRGDIVVLNVWASWCAPCRSEAPALREVAKQTADEGVQFVGLVTRDGEATATAFAERNGLDYPHVMDSDGSLQLQFRDTLPPAAIPSTIVIDRQGRVAARVLGEVSAPGLRGILEPLIAETVDSP